MPWNCLFDFIMLTPISSKHLGMHFGVWNESKHLICFENFMGDPTENWRHSSTSQMKEACFCSELISWACSSSWLSERPSSFPCVRILVLHPLSPDLSSALLLTYLGPRRGLTSMDINRLHVLWLRIRFGTKEMQRRKERGIYAIPALWSGEVCIPLWAQLLLRASHTSFYGPKGFSNMLLPPAPSVLWWPSSPPPPCWFLDASLSLVSILNCIRK